MVSSAKITDDGYRFRSIQAFPFAPICFIFSHFPCSVLLVLHLRVTCYPPSPVQINTAVVDMLNGLGYPLVVTL
jgi:hypothetical protein